MPLGIHASPGNSTATWDKYLDRTLRLKFDLFWREKYFSRTWSFSKHINTMQKAFRNAGMLLRLTKSSRAYLLVFILMVWHVFRALSCPMYMFMFLFLISIQNSFQVSCFPFFFQERKYTIQSTEPRANLRTRRPLATRHVALSNDRENENPERKLKLKFLMVNKWNFYPSNRIHNVSWNTETLPLNTYLKKCKYAFFFVYFTLL